MPATPEPSPWFLISLWWDWLLAAATTAALLIACVVRPLLKNNPHRRPRDSRPARPHL